jgi:hypothetical protein
LGYVGLETSVNVTRQQDPDTLHVKGGLCIIYCICYKPHSANKEILKKIGIFVSAAESFLGLCRDVIWIITE